MALNVLWVTFRLVDSILINMLLWVKNKFLKISWIVHLLSQRGPTLLFHQRRLSCKGFLKEGLQKVAMVKNVVMVQHWRLGLLQRRLQLWRQWRSFWKLLMSNMQEMMTLRLPYAALFLLMVSSNFHKGFVMNGYNCISGFLVDCLKSLKL